MDRERVKNWLESVPQPDEGILVERALSEVERRAIKPRRSRFLPVALGGVAVATFGIAALRPYFRPASSSGISEVEKNVSMDQKPVSSVQKPAPLIQKPVLLAQKPVLLVQPSASLVQTPASLVREPALLLQPPASLVQPSASLVRTPVQIRRKPSLLTKPFVEDDLTAINADPEIIAARWNKKSVEVPDVRAEDDNQFITVPPPQVASLGSPGVALSAWEAERQIVDVSLQKRVKLQEKGISFSALCERLTKETGVAFTASRAVADDKITVFCDARTLRDLMRQVNRIFGYTWDRLGADPDYRYRLVQPLKAQLAEVERRNKEKSNQFVSFVTLRSADGGEASLGLDVLRGGLVLQDTAKEFLFTVTPSFGETREGETKEAPLRALISSGSLRFVADGGAPWTVLSLNGILSSEEGQYYPDPENEKENKELSEFPVFQEKVNLSPEPTVTKEKLCTTADVLEAVYKATGKDVMGDYFTRFSLQAEVTVKNKTLFDALNLLGNKTRLRWNWEKARASGESDWLQFRTSGYYNAREREVPNRLLERWQDAASRQEGKLSARELGEIGRLLGPQLDSSNMAKGAMLLYGLTEWPLVQDATLRPHWRTFGLLSAGRQQEAQGEKGLGFRILPLDNQQELASLIASASMEMPPSEQLSPQQSDVQDEMLKKLILDQRRASMSFDDFSRAVLRVRYPAPVGEPIFRYQRLGQPQSFWKWEVGQGSSVTKPDE